MIDEAPPVSADRLACLRELGRKMRDLAVDVAALEGQLKAKKAELLAIEHVEFPEKMQEFGVDRVGLPADGSHPSVDFDLKPYYHAVIAAGWPEDKRLEAFQHLEQKGYGSVIKFDFHVNIERGELERARKLEAALTRMGLAYSSKLDVPWGTLTSLVKEEMESGSLTLDLEKIGATVGMVVKRKIRKEKI